MNSLILGLLSWCSAAMDLTRAPVETPQQVAQSLLDADRAFAMSGARGDVMTALTPMFAGGVIMPTPQGNFAIGKRAVLAALRTSPDATARVSWAPIRVGISADGEHGFTFGYMTLVRPDSTRVPLKYMAYWVRDVSGWHVLAYKRGRSAGAPPETRAMSPSLPAAMIPARRDGAAIATLRHDLMQAEHSFSQEAQKIGLGNAFAAYATAYSLTSGGAGVHLVPIDIGSYYTGNVLNNPHLAQAMAFGMFFVLAVMMLVYIPLQRRAARWAK